MLGDPSLLHIHQYLEKYYSSHRQRVRSTSNPQYDQIDPVHETQIDIHHEFILLQIYIFPMKIQPYFYSVQNLANG